jgi:hypothetical protein
MPIVIRQADLNQDLGDIAETLNSSFQCHLGLDRFQWLYQRNPDGPAISWLALDEGSGQIVGTTAVCPRRVRIGGTGRDVIAWNCCDFSIRSRYRTLGTAIKLRRAARAGVDAGQSHFLYAHPNERMLAVHLQVGHYPLGKMVRHAKPLRTSSGLRSVDKAASIALRVMGARPWRHTSDETELVDMWPVAALDDLFDAASRRLGTTVVVRDGRYLDWRFRQNPMERSEMIVTRRRGRLTGYLLFTLKEEVGLVKDWLAIDPPAVDALFRSLIAEMRRRDAPSISVTALESHPDLARLTALGFLRRRDSTTAVVYANAGLAESNMVTNPSNWYMTLGDRDV